MVKLEKRSDSCNTRSISNCVEETQRLNVYFETALGRAKPQTANKIDKRSYKNSRLKSFLTVTLGKKLSAQSLMYFNSKLDSTRNILTDPNFRRWFSSFDRSSRKGRKQSFHRDISYDDLLSLSLSLSLSDTLSIRGTQDEPRPDDASGRNISFPRGRIFHNYSSSEGGSGLSFSVGKKNFRRQEVDIPLKALGRVNKPPLYTMPARMRRVFFLWTRLLFSLFLSFTHPTSNVLPSLSKKSFHSFTRGLLKLPIGEASKGEEARYLVKRKRKWTRTFLPIELDRFYR